MTKSKLLPTIAVLGGALMGTGATAASDPHGLEATAKALNYTTTGASASVYGIIATGVSFFLGLLAFVFFGLTLYAGIRWMIARGQQEYIEKAKNTLTNSIIGLAIVVSAYALTTFILRLLGA